MINKQETNTSSSKSHRISSWIKKLLAKTEAKIAFKTGLAASISLVIGLSYTKFLNRPDALTSGLWCVMASIVVIQAHLGGTYQAAWIRFLGVIVGSMAGAFLINLIGSDALSLGISVFFTIILCALLNIKDSFRIAGLSTAIIIVMAGRYPTINPWLFSFYRFLDSCIGILTAVFVARVIWPEKALENIRQNIAKTLNLLSKYFRSINLEASSQEHAVISQSLFSEIIDLLEENKQYGKEAEIELFDNISLCEHWTLVTNQLEIIFESVDNLNNVHKAIIANILDDGLAKQLTKTVQEIDLAFQSLEKMIKSDPPFQNLSQLNECLKELNNELLRFRDTRRTRKFNMEDVESFFVFFFALRSIGEALIKMESQIAKFAEIQ